MDRIRTRCRRLLPLLLLTLVSACASSTGGGPDEEAPAPEYVAGETYYGTYEYIEYLPGDLPLIITAPHGGYLQPPEIPDRSGAGIVTVPDSRTQELARQLRDTFQTQIGGIPYIVICRLARTKLDANRNLAEGALGDPRAATAWNEWHTFINAAKQRVEEDFGQGLYIDLHGHGHEIPRLELGYLLSSSDLAQDDSALNDSAYIIKSSMRTLTNVSDSTFASIIRGDASFGTLIETLGYPAVPSSLQPSPGSDPYFSGGYNTRVHGSRTGNTYISGLQIECNYRGVRDSEANRAAFSQAVAGALESFFAAHFDIPLAPAAAAEQRSMSGAFSLVGPTGGP
ncbi:MAG: hypothetical protein R6W82_11675 [bacterium]